MRKMSKKDKAERFDALARECDVYKEVSFLLLNNRAPDAVESFEYDGDTYEFRLYAPERCHAGILVHLFRSDVNGYAVVEAERFDDWAQKIAALPYGIGCYTEVKIARERLVSARHEIFEKKRQAFLQGRT